MEEIVKLEQHLQKNDKPDVIRASAKSIASIAIERYDAELLIHALTLSGAIAQFANDLEKVQNEAL